MKTPKIVKHIPPSPETLGLCDKEEKMVYINMKQSQKQILITLLHEALHFIHPEYTEEKIEEDANFLGEMTWKMGFRLKDTAKLSRKYKKKTGIKQRGIHFVI